LLIFFLLSSTFIVQPGIKVKLPKSESSEVTSDKNITISISRDGAYYLNEERVLLSSLPAMLRQKFVYGKEQIIVIKADRDVTLQSAVDVMDIAKNVGFDKFSIATEQKNE
ncbi:biopolymer transporter ExbD, partial [bacterium]|nr:biopolymer transporter ExbD [bacterium]